jgi:hypothetical protein
MDAIEVDFEFRAAATACAALNAGWMDLFMLRHFDGSAAQSHLL